MKAKSNNTPRAEPPSKFERPLARAPVGVDVGLRDHMLPMTFCPKWRLIEAVQRASVIGLLGVFILGNTPAEDLAAKWRAAPPPIAELEQKVFRITTAASGLRSMSLITGYSGEAWRQPWWNEGYGKPCTQNVAMLNRPWRATIVNVNDAPGILAFLDCPAANDGGAESIVAFFRPGRTSNALCFDHIALMRERSPNAFYYGSISALDVRTLTDTSHVAVLTLEGGDAGDSWKSYALVHIDVKCRAALLARTYSSMHRDTDNEDKCQGETAAHTFRDNTTVEIRTEKVTCTVQGMRTLSKRVRTLDVPALIANPAMRRIEP